MTSEAKTRGAPRAAETPTDSAPFPTGKVLISAAALFPAAGAFLADWNETHLFNPRWTPHAKFHDGQTITLAVEAAGLSLWQLWGPGPDTVSRLRWAVLLGSLFWLTQPPALVFPGTAVVDDDNPTQPFSVAGIPINQVTATAAILLPLLAAGYALATRRLRRTEPPARARTTPPATAEANRA